MKKRVWVLSVPVFLAFSAIHGHAQTAERPVVTGSLAKPPVVAPPPIKLPLTQAPAATPPPIKLPVTQTPAVTPSPVQGAQPTTGQVQLVQTPIVPPVIPRPAKPLAMREFQARLTEAQRLLKSKPLLTSFSLPGSSIVRMALLEPGTSAIHIVTLSKDLFLLKGAQVPLTTSLGKLVRLNVIRANGVNTAVTVFDDSGTSYSPLVVEYPIEKFGQVREIAYYTSAHPALLSPEVVNSGRNYVRTMIDLAAKRLKLAGVSIAPNILDTAERLCLVEHIDHDRFRKENRLNLFDEIFSLYALNELETYKYSVSVAGAGGMVQMIPATYRMLRNRHPAVGLNPDFVVGMRNHGNALEAMLLYMQDTWNDLLLNPEIMDALSAKIATPAELMSAGYNSNPAKLPLYLRRGGSDWRNLIPRETQMYLQIYQSVDSLVPMKPRA